MKTVGIDEPSAARGQDYITLFCDLHAPRVVYATADRDQHSVRRFAQDLAAHGGDPEAVQEVCCDMSPAFIRGIGEHLPAAAITFDRYHLAQQLSQALDEVRRQEVHSRPELRGTRYVWLKRPANLRQEQAAQLAYLRARQRGMRTARAYAWRLAFEAFFEQPVERAPSYLERWYQGAVRSRLAPIQNFAYLIDDHWQGVLRWHQTRISNGMLEAINSLVQAAKRRARGYRTKHNLIAITYLIAGKLDLQLAHSNSEEPIMASVRGLFRGTSAFGRLAEPVPEQDVTTLTNHFGQAPLSIKAILALTV